MDRNSSEAPSEELPDWYLVRHASSMPDAKTPTHRWPLTDSGWRQALQLPEQLAQLGIAERLDRIVSSPYQRARDTVMPLAQACGVSVTSCVDLRERDIAGWFESPDALADQLRNGWQDFDYVPAPPGEVAGRGESNAIVQTRLVGAVTRLHREFRAQSLLLSGHGQAISVLLHAMSEADPHSAFEQWQAMPNPALYRLQRASDDVTQWRYQQIDLKSV